VRRRPGMRESSSLGTLVVSVAWYVPPMKARFSAPMRGMKVDELGIRDERSFRHVDLYRDLKAILRRDGYIFRILPDGPARWDRALLLNLTFWGGSGSEVLEGESVFADVVTHAAWHHLAARALATAGAAHQSVEALFLGESIASAFDVYLVGRLLGQVRRSSFLETQVPALAEAASAAGLSKRGFQRLLHEVAADPERAFADLRALLFDVTTTLSRCSGADEALAVLVRFEGHRFAPFLHHYELSNWVLFARAHGRRGRRPDRRVPVVEKALRTSEMPLSWLVSHWVAPALAGGVIGP
jgi:hypothetical protein